MSKRVFILRGLPGAGKSTWMHRHMIECKTSIATVSADTFHYVHPEPVDGVSQMPVYEFKPENTRKAHAQCLRDFLEAIDQGWQHIVVDNTNISAWEIAPYYQVAEVSGYSPEIVNFPCDPDTSEKRNTHKVPREVIDKMYARLAEPLPSWWHQTAGPSHRK